MVDTTPRPFKAVKGVYYTLDYKYRLSKSQVIYAL